MINETNLDLCENQSERNNNIYFNSTENNKSAYNTTSFLSQLNYTYSPYAKNANYNNSINNNFEMPDAINQLDFDSQFIDIDNSVDLQTNKNNSLNFSDLKSRAVNKNSFETNTGKSTGKYEKKTELSVDISSPAIDPKEKNSLLDSIYQEMGIERFLSAEVVKKT